MIDTNQSTTTPVPEPQPPSTAGMTTKVVKGSIWTMFGSVAPLLVSLASTPIVIRLLGSDAYGVVILVGLIPQYFMFADLGMGVASTKYGSEAFGNQDSQSESRVVYTAAVLAFVSAMIFAVPMFLLSDQIIANVFSVPEKFHSAAAIALKITSVSFVFGIIASVVNTPILARLRLDISAAVNSVPKVLMGIATPIVLLMGGFIVAAVSVAWFASVIILVATVYFAHRFQPEILRAGFDRSLVAKLIKFGGAWQIALVAAQILSNVEKFFIARYLSVESLAYYSIAFTFANMATMFSLSMTQSLIPAFSQLTSPDRHAEFDALYKRSIRLNLIVLLPILMGMAVVAHKFFAVWAGPDFGRNSTGPFYVLLVGLFFNLLATIPHSVIMAHGRTEVFAKLYWIELAIYVGIAAFLVSRLGIVGAAMAWTLRVVVDAFLVIYFARRISNLSAGLRGIGLRLGACGILLLPPIGLVAFVDESFLLLIPAVAVSLSTYAYFVWRFVVDEHEKYWFIDKLSKLPVFSNGR